MRDPMKARRFLVVERLFNVWQRLTGSLWFVPGVIVFGAVAVAILLVDASTHVDSSVLAQYPRVFGATPESSSKMLSTIAGAIITVAGVTFSVLVVAVAQASSQYTPRVLRNFMRDRLSQVTLGALVGVFIYCLVVLRTIRTEEGQTFLPALAVLGALIFAVIAVALLVYFIHHIASTLEVGSIVANIAAETVAAIDRQYPDDANEDNAIASVRLISALDQGGMRWWPVESWSTGYIQHVEFESLCALAHDAHCVVRLNYGAGDFTVAGGPMLQVLAAEPPDEKLISELRSRFVIDSYRTVYQDVGFGIRQMVDIANKALSPGINDPTTAITCIEYLSAIFVHLVAKRFEHSHRYIGERLCLIQPQRTFDEFLSDGFTEIRRSGSAQPRVLASVLRALELIALATRSSDRLHAVNEQLRLVHESLEASPGPIPDRARALQLCSRIQTQLHQRVGA
ncbi:MAG TPA: DUF2254 domain-containing protein [Steroidobacteraceae bacterium]|nr:DUF2254 domain-containing protein [Steroidobacteraceae bacterium]